MTSNLSNAMKLQQQLDKERRLVSTDSYDLSVGQLLSMFEAGEIEVPPEYQRQFVWDEVRESQLIESVLLGIPIPSLFMATNADSTWEIVDGVQRLGTIAHFSGRPDLLRKVIKNEPLKITGLDKLSALNGQAIEDLPKPLQLMFNTRPMRVTVLNDKSDQGVRFDLFERLNTGGISLTNQEIRNCVFRGPFNEDLKRLSSHASFLSSVKIKSGDQRNGTLEEFVLRFFAFFDSYVEFDHSVKDFLNEYMKSRASGRLGSVEERLFKDTFDVISQHLPHGIVRGQRVTPVNLFEGVAVGVALAIKSGRPVHPARLAGLLGDSNLRKFTTGATNSKKAVVGRIEYVRDALVR
ncbi:hypothetical protein C405_09530 [Stenotrophomonas maltophilia AU12-09]|uniref:DUF262 domain-containing protein n=1 Tax=Stenotrophomonas maltophilia TaxID=40324 RepID=UPI0002C0024C|nr:DUF262 domain-containing protein [Stenotrophomonas maltophilia]EMI49792.1 hypothetical protein C405_09530 [Stenotrophomonas maltophilia AU12-09]